MLNYPAIVAKLNLRQKLALLTDLKSLSNGEIDRAGIPAVVLASLEEINAVKPLFPSLFELARSWDPDLYGEVSAYLASTAAANGVRLVSTPDLKSAVSPYALRLSEDPYLCGTLGRECLGGIRRAGVGSCLNRRSLAREDVEYLDVKEDRAAVEKLYEAPFALAAEEGADAMIASLARPEGDYSDVNRRLVHGVMKDGFLLLEDVPGDMDLGALLQGSVCLGGAVLPLDSALLRYRRLKELAEEGSASKEEADAAVRRGTALPEEAIDEAVDRIIGFAYAIAEKKAVPPSSPDGLLARAAEESTVLLKNEDVLPLAAETKVAVIGALAAEGEDNFAKRFSRVARLDHGLVPVGQAAGYLLAGERSEELIPEAVQLAEEADVVLLFLGQGAEREREMPVVKSVALPANQLALAAALRRTGKKIVAVLSGDYPADMSFDKDVDAVLLAPLAGTVSHDVLIEILTGKRSPSGRLSRTYYDNTDELFLALKNYKDAGRNKVGDFVGYRRYDTAGIPPRYPFGHGLSYTDFAYSALEINETGIRFTLANRGTRAGTETVQVYAGKGGVRPKKELIAYVRVALGPGESRAVEIPLPAAQFSHFSENSHAPVPDGGMYTLYVGASVSDIRLKGLYQAEGESLPPREGALSDYLQSYSDLMHRGYTLKEARVRVLRNRKEHRVTRIAAWVLLAVTVLVDILLAAAHASLPSLAGYAGWMAAINLFLVLSVIALIAERATRGKGALADLPADSEKFRGAATAPSDELERFFVKALEEKEEETEHPAVQEEGEYFDEALTFAKAVQELSLCAEEHGVALTEDSARSLMAAIASTRCIVLRGTAKPLITLAAALCEYFGSAFRADPAENYRGQEDLFYKDGDHGVRVKSNFYRTLSSAAELTPYLHFAVLTQVKLSALGNYFRPIAERLRDPRMGQTVDPEGYGRDGVAIPPNLRFVLILSEGQDAADIPACVADVCSWLSPEYKLVSPRKEKSLPSPFGYRQLIELNRRVRLLYELDEPLWKKVDRLEAVANTFGAYHIGNRVWLAAECHAAVYLACGGSPTDALDSVVAGKLLARILALRKGGKREKLLPVLEEIFGEGNIPRCARMLRQVKGEGEEEI